MQLGVLTISTAAQEEWGQREPHKHKDSKSQMISLLFGFFFSKKERFRSTDLKPNVLLMGKGSTTAGALTAR